MLCGGGGSDDGSTAAEGGLWSSKKIFLGGSFQMDVTLGSIPCDTTSSLKVCIESGSFWNISPVHIDTSVVEEEDDMEIDDPLLSSSEAPSSSSIKENDVTAPAASPATEEVDTESIMMFMSFTGEETLTIAKAFLNETNQDLERAVSLYMEPSQKSRIVAEEMERATKKASKEASKDANKSSSSTGSMTTTTSTTASTSVGVEAAIIASSASSSTTTNNNDALDIVIHRHPMHHLKGALPQCYTVLIRVRSTQQVIGACYNVPLIHNRLTLTHDGKVASLEQRAPGNKETDDKKQQQKYPTVTFPLDTSSWLPSSDFRYFVGLTNGGRLETKYEVEASREHLPSELVSFKICGQSNLRAEEIFTYDEDGASGAKKGKKSKKGEEDKNGKEGEEGNSSGGGMMMMTTKKILARTRRRTSFCPTQ